MKRLFLILAILLFPALGYAQQTTITATVTDPNNKPWANATGRASIICPGNQAPLYNGYSVPRTYTIVGMNSFGAFSLVLYDVNAITPSGCSYAFSFVYTDGITQFTTPGIGGSASATPITGSGPVNLSTVISSYSPILPASGGGSGTVTAVTATTPVVSSGGTTPVISCPTCSTTSGTVTAVTGTAPIVSSGGNTPALSCPTCNTSSATIAGSIASGQIPFGSGTNTISGSNSLEYGLYPVFNYPTLYFSANSSTTGNAILSDTNGGGLQIIGRNATAGDGYVTITAGNASSPPTSIEISSTGGPFFQVFQGTSNAGDIYFTPGNMQIYGTTSGNAILGVAATAGTPNRINLPTSTGSANAILQTNGSNPQQTSWTLAPNLTLIGLTEGSSPGGTSSTDVFFGNSSIHWPEFIPNSGSTYPILGLIGTLTGGDCLEGVGTYTAQDSGSPCGSGGSGTVTSFSAGNLSPLFTTSVATASTTPALTFTIDNIAGYKVLGNTSSGSGAIAAVSLSEAMLPNTTVFTDIANTFGAHLNSFASSTVEVPTSSGFTSGSTSDLGIDSATGYWHGYQASNDRLFMFSTNVGTSGQLCASNANGTCTFAAAPSTLTPETNSVTNSSTTLLNFTSTTGASGINFSNPSGGVEEAVVANTTGGGNALVAATFTGFAQGDFVCGNSTPIAVNCVQGVVPNPQTGTTYTVQGGDGGSSDRGKVILCDESSAALAITLPQAGTTGFGGNFNFAVFNEGTYACTITPTTSTINGGSSIVYLPGQQGNIFSDNSNYYATRSGYASGTTGTITGTSLSATCDSGTATVEGATAGMPVSVSSTTGADVGGAFYLRGSVTSSNTVTVYVCGIGTPSSLAYNVRVLP